MTTSPNRRRVSIRLTILALFFLVAAVMAVTALSLHYLLTRNMAENIAEQHFADTAAQTAAQALSLEAEGINLAFAFQYHPAAAETLAVSEARGAVDAMISLLRRHPGVFTLFVGYPNGDYLEVANLEASAKLRTPWRAAPDDRWVVTRVLTRDGERLRLTDYRNDQGKLRLRLEQDTQFDARERPWFEAASTERVTIVPPYLFRFVQQPGSSYALRTPGGSVVGSSTLSSSLREVLNSDSYTGTYQAYLFNATGQIRAFSEYTPDVGDLQTPEINPTAEQSAWLAEHRVITVANLVDYPPLEYAVAGEPRGYSIDLVNMLADMAGVEVEYVNGLTFEVLLEQLRAGDVDLMLSTYRTQQREQWGVYSQPTARALMVAASDAQDAPVLSLDDLSNRRIALQRGYATNEVLRERFPDASFVIVENTLQALEAIRDGHADVVVDVLPVMYYLTRYFFFDDIRLSDSLPAFSEDDAFAFHFLAPKSHRPLIEMLDAAMQALPDEAQQRLRDQWLIDPPLYDLSSPMVTGQVPHSALRELASNRSARGQLQSLSIDGQPHFVFVEAIEGRTEASRQEFIGLMVSEQEVLSPYMSTIRQSTVVLLAVFLLLFPVVFVAARLLVRPIQRLIEENNKVRRRDYTAVRYVPSTIKEMHQLSRSLVEMSESICDYERAQRDLLDAFIKLLAQAIDEKSPYTGGHCERVPEVAKLLANAAHEQMDGPFAEFRFESETEWREFKIAAWLHDCGKVTTPEHIVDKGSKLECIYNRIHEIRMRFEVLWREAEIVYLKQRQTSPERDAEWRQQRDDRQARIRDDFAFVAACNVGGEFMADGDIERLHRIARTRWTRYLDNRLGLSPVETEHLAKHGTTAPCEELLLADKDEHIFPRDQREFDRNEGYGFTLKPTKNKQNLGELHNLSLRRGTLTDEDRYIINEHIISTIRMLETLPLPDELSRVPEYAGGHHEAMSGKGYPRSLTRDQLSIPARIMAVADIFEALTASDRPYKRAKTLSQALKIMRYMVDDEHIDADLFRLFVETEIYRVYADRFLLPSQTDNVDKEALLTVLP
jgi:HD-GYP domain-containing protein (c-di-GMP phosphodiesterase class II)/ABC-type amino acid transport substrate-binding protein